MEERRHWHPSCRIREKGISSLRFRGIEIADRYTSFDDRPAFDAVEPIGRAYLDGYSAGDFDRLDVVYTKFQSIAKQSAIIETLLPLAPPESTGSDTRLAQVKPEYDFYPSSESILEELLPASFLSRLFKCFLDSAVSEQVARMVAMKAASENAGSLIKDLSRRYNRGSAVSDYWRNHGDSRWSRSLERLIAVLFSLAVFIPIHIKSLFIFFRFNRRMLRS